MNIRDKILGDAGSAINGDRAREYGDCTQNFLDIANIVNVLFRPLLKDEAKIEPLHVGQFMMAVKLARTMKVPTEDSFVDMAGYAATTYEAIRKTDEKKG